jgi:deoxyribose-phosphate aldolase
MVNTYIDHTLLKQNATKDQILQLCAEAKQYQFASVCVNPTWVTTCKEALKGTKVKVCVVIGFPLGATTSETKAFEAHQALFNGAEEFDMVINVGALKDKNYELVEDDIAAVVNATGGLTVKVIIETCLLSDDEKVKACQLAVKAKAHFVKTSTGFSTAGATVADVKLMKEAVSGKALVKAAGGVRTMDDVKAMIEAGADRIGTSGGVALMTQTEMKTAY